MGVYLLLAGILVANLGILVLGMMAYTRFVPSKSTQSQPQPKVQPEPKKRVSRKQAAPKMEPEPRAQQPQLQQLAQQPSSPSPSKPQPQSRFELEEPGMEEIFPNIPPIGKSHGIVFCRNCGIQFDSSEIICPRCQTPHS